MIIFTVLVAALSYFIISSLSWINNRKQKHKLFIKYGIPGPKPSLFMGNLHQLRQAPVPTDVITKWIKEYGNIFGYYVGGIPHLVINDIGILKNIVIKDFNNFTNRKPMSVVPKPVGDSVLGLVNLRWKEVRGILTPTFSSSKIKTMFSIINAKAFISVEVVNAKAEKNEEFDMHCLSECLALDVIADAALALKVNCQRNLEDPFLVATKVFCQSVNSPVVIFAQMFPGLNTILKLLVPYTTAGKMIDMIVKNLENVLKYRRSNPGKRGTDLLQLMLDASELEESASSQKKTVRLTDDEIIGNACIALFAGYESTGNTLAFTFHLLVQYPDIQEKLYAELNEKWPENGELTYDVINNMTYLDQVINESLRIFPPVITFVTRECQGDYDIGQYTIAKGVTVMVPVWDIQHDPNLWPDPFTFDPERFSPENKSKIDKMSYLPFGVGPRNCIGMRVALLELKLAVARLVKKFQFVPSDRTENPLILMCPTAVNTPKNGVYLKAKLR